MAMDFAKGITEFRWHGRGGQGVVTSNQKNPIQVYAQVYNPDVVVCIDQTLLDDVNVTEGLKEEGTLVVNSNSEPQTIRNRFDFTGGTVVTVDASTIAMEVMGRPFYNMPTMAAGVKVTGVVAVETVINEVLARYPGKIGDLNKVAIERAVKEAKVG
jgi:pyruvate ferredoxin oxidoreductase gamma subunit